MRSRRLKNEINVVPYIDVMLVLLVIFMVTAPMMTTASIDIPSVGKAVQAQPPANALQVEVSESEELTLIDTKQNRRRVSRSQLAQEIAAAQRRDPDLAVVVAGDKAVRYQAVLRVMDELQQKQVKRIGLLVQPTGK